MCVGTRVYAHFHTNSCVMYTCMGGYTHMPALHTYMHVGVCVCLCIRDSGSMWEPMPVPEQVLDSRNQEE